MNLKTVQENWIDFKNACISKDASPIQLKSMRLAFFAGAAVIQKATVDLGSPEIPEDTAVRYLEKLRKEMQEFYIQEFLLQKIPGRG